MDALELKHLDKGDYREFPGVAGRLIFNAVDRTKGETLGRMEEMIGSLRKAETPSEFHKYIPKLRAYFEEVKRVALGEMASYGSYARGRSRRGEAIRAA